MPRPVVVGAGEVLWDVFPDGDHFGGAPANVALHAAALGAEAWLVSAVGQDERGAAALARLDAAGVRRDTVTPLADRPTGIVEVRLDAAGQPGYAIAPGAAWDQVPWSAAVDRLAARADAISFGSLAQRTPATRATVRRAVVATRATAWRLFDLNLRKGWYDAEVVAVSLELANAVKLNEEELAVVAPLCGLGVGPVALQLRALCDRFRLRLAALTRGARGSVIVTPTEMYETTAPRTTVADTVGAGDAFTAALLVGLLAGHSLAAVSERANLVAAYVCSQPGATPPIPARLRWVP